MSTVAAVLEVPGVSTYLDAVEERLRETVAREGGEVAAAGVDTLASGGKRLRPMLVHLCAPPAGRARPGLVAAGCAVELVHMATLVHDDQIDAAPLRRGRPTVWRARGPLVSTATGDHLFARAFSELVTTGDMQAVTVLSDACLALARGEILQREQAGNADTTPEQYLERCRLKTGRLSTTRAPRPSGTPRPRSLRSTDSTAESMSPRSARWCAARSSGERSGPNPWGQAPSGAWPRLFGFSQRRAVGDGRERRRVERAVDPLVVGFAAGQCVLPDGEPRVREEAGLRILQVVDRGDAPTVPSHSSTAAGDRSRTTSS